MVLFCYYRMYFLYVHIWVVVCIVLGLAFCIYTYCEIEEYTVEDVQLPQSQKDQVLNPVLSFFLRNVLFPNACIAVPFIACSVLRKS